MALSQLRKFSSHNSDEAIYTLRGVHFSKQVLLEVIEHRGLHNKMVCVLVEKNTPQTLRTF